MNQQPPENEIKKLLENLNYPSHADIMQQKLFFIQTETIRQQRINDERVVEVLMNISANNLSSSVRKEANKTLKYLGITPPPLNLKLVNWLLIGFLVGLFSVLVLANVFSMSTLGAIIFGSPGFLLALVGAFIGKRSMVSALIGATVGAILWLLFAINTCLLCQ